MQQKPNPKFHLAATVQLRDPHYFARLQMAAAGCGISDRDFATAVQDMLLRIDMQDGEIWTTPERVEIPLIDEAWSDERYLRRFLEAKTCEHPQKARWIDLYFRVTHPQIARHFGR